MTLPPHRGRRTVMEIGGWASSQMLDEVYSHVSDDHKADVMSCIDVGMDEEDDNFEEGDDLEE